MYNDAVCLMRYKALRRSNDLVKRVHSRRTFLLNTSLNVEMQRVLQTPTNKLV